MSGDAGRGGAYRWVCGEIIGLAKLSVDYVR